MKTPTDGRCEACVREKMILFGYSWEGFFTTNDVSMVIGKVIGVYVLERCRWWRGAANGKSIL
ncbi:hypothetical protein V4Y24_004718 [Escherichia coli]|nr:hypothetical protein [Escherichia coli]EFF1117767.1 hypothetical protein [Escherichia coli]